MLVSAGQEPPVAQQGDREEGSGRSGPGPSRGWSGIAALVGAALVGAVVALAVLAALNDGQLRFVPAAGDPDGAEGEGAVSARLADLETAVAVAGGPAATPTPRVARPTMTLRIASRGRPSPTQTPVTPSATPTVPDTPTASPSPSTTPTASTTPAPTRTTAPVRTPRATPTLRIVP